MVQLKVEYGVQAKLFRCAGMAGFSGKMGQEAVVERSRIDRMEHSGSRSRGKSIQDYRHSLHARGKDRTRDCSKFPSADASQSFERVAQPVAMKGQRLIDHSSLAR